MYFRLLLPCIALASLLGGSGAFSEETQDTSVGLSCPNPDYIPLHVRAKPLLDLIAKGEGNYNSVNRGYAGDTPGGIQRLTGKPFAKYTVGEVMAYQRSWLYAVGRYQFIPRTFRFAVAHSDVSHQDLFTPEVQDQLAIALIIHKRPAVGAYLRGEHSNLGWAMNEMAYEWAAIEYRNGRGYYDGYSGNRASISRYELAQVLNQIKDSWAS